MNIFPCKDCKNRYVGCHSECAAYNNAKKTHNDNVNTLREKKKKENLGAALQIEAIQKTRRRMKGKR